MHLMIENKGEAPPEAFTLLGDSGSRGRSDSIGQFGSGAKHAILILMRKNTKFKVCTGTTTLNFYPKRHVIKDSDGSQRETWVVECQTSGKINRKMNLNWDLSFGSLDWTSTDMALREFTSNAIDWSGRNGGEAVVRPEANPRARSGYTRIFVELNGEVQDFYRELGRRFLYFSNKSLIKQTFLPKDPESVGPRVYFEGVFITELRSQIASVFDYNFKKGEIKIDECRNSDEYTLRARIAQCINKADSKVLSTLFKAMAEGEVYEASLDEFYLGYSSDSKENWTEAWEGFAGEAVIASESLARSPIAEHAQAKGHKVVAVKSKAFVEVAQKMGVRNVTKVLGTHAASGKIPCEVTDAAIQAVERVWEWIETANMTGGKIIPGVKCFRQLMDGEGECLGYYQPGSGEVHIREDLDGKIALKTAIEEVAHYITGSTDCSRDFQNFAFDMIVELCV